MITDMRNLYYTIDPDYEYYDEDLAELTGHKDVSVYEIEDNKIGLIFTLKSYLSSDTEKEIKEYIEENFDDEEYTLKRL